MAARVPNRVTSVAYKLAKPVPIKAEGPIPADLIEKLQAKFNFSDSIVAELKRHTRIDPSYPNALRGDLLRGLLILLEQELSPDNITAIANQLIEGAPQCTQGFHNRVNELVTGFVTPKNISELLYQIRGDIVRKAARTLSDDVHVNNSFFKVANLEKYGIEQINVHDEYWGSKPYPAIRSALERTFSSDFQYIDVLALLSKMAKSVLIMRAGYSGRRPVGDPYKAEYYNKFEALLGGIPFELPGGIREFAVFDEDTYEVYDLNWNHINQLLFKKLCTDRFLELSNETTKIINQIFEDEDKVLSAEDCQALSDLDLKHLLRLLSLMDSNHHQKILSLIDAHMNRSDDPAHRMTILKETLKEINGNKALTVKVVEKYTDLFQIYKRGINRNTLINKIQAQEFSYIDKLALDSMNSEQQAELLTPNEHGVNAIMVAAIKQPNILEDLLVIMNKLNHDSIKAILLQMSQVDIKVFGRIFEAMIKSSKAKIAKDFLELYLSINPHAIIENIGPNLVAMHEQGYQLSEQEDLVLLYFNQLKRLSFEERMLGYYTLVQQLPKRQESLLEFIHELFRAEVSEITVERLLAILNIASADSEHTRTIIKQLSSEAINFQDAEGVSLLKRMIRLNNIGAIEALLLRSDLRLVLHEEIIFAARHEPSTLNTLLTHLRKLDESAQLLEFTAIARGETRDLFVVIEKLEKMEDSNNKLICSLIKTHLSDLTGVNLTNKLVEILNNCISNPELTSMIIESLPSDWVNIQDEHGNSLLMRMAATKNDAAISALVKRSELDLSIVNDAGDNVIKQVGFPLLDDSTSTPERRSIFKKLLDRVKDLDEIAQKKLFQHLNRQENFFSNLLTVALYVFNEEEDAFSAELIRKATPAQLNASDNAINGTALHFAIMNHREKTAMQLLKHGADVNVQNVYGTTQLHQLLRNINTCRPVELDNIEQLAKALINQESLNLSLLDNEHLSTLQVAMNMISQEQNAYKRALLEKIMMEIALKISKLPIERQREMLRDIPGGPYGSAMSFLFLGVKRFETFFEAIKQLNETQLIEHLSSPEFLSELARSKNAQVQWLNQARWFSRYRFTTPFTLNLTGCLLSDSNIRFKWSEYSHELFIVNYLKNCIPKKVNAVNLSGNELHLRSSAELYFYILKSIPLTVERVAINRNVFLDRAILLALFQNNLFCKTINTMSVADCKLYCRGLKENVSQFMELNPNFIKEVSKLSPEKRNAVLKGFDSSFLNAALSPVGSDLVTCRKNLVD
ncbi:MAG: hypothetical protein NTW94_02780, partial [Legionellales bacterium]|nr:hypothetical protein [Legionellales bacterium]